MTELVRNATNDMNFEDDKWREIARRHAEDKGFLLGTKEYDWFVKRFMDGKYGYFCWYEMRLKGFPYTDDEYKEKYLDVYASLPLVDWRLDHWPFTLCDKILTERLMNENYQYSAKDKWWLLWGGLGQLVLLSIIILVVCWLGSFGIALIITMAWFVLKELFHGS